MLHLKGWTADRMRTRASELDAEAVALEALGCSTLSRLKRRDAATYRHQLIPAVVAQAETGRLGAL